MSSLDTITVIEKNLYLLFSNFSPLLGPLREVCHMWSLLPPLPISYLRNKPKLSYQNKLLKFEICLTYHINRIKLLNSD